MLCDLRAHRAVHFPSAFHRRCPRRVRDGLRAVPATEAQQLAGLGAWPVTTFVTAARADRGRRPQLRPHSAAVTFLLCRSRCQATVPLARVPAAPAGEEGEPPATHRTPALRGSGRCRRGVSLWVSPASPVATASAGAACAHSGCFCRHTRGTGPGETLLCRCGRGSEALGQTLLLQRGRKVLHLSFGQSYFQNILLPVALAGSKSPLFGKAKSRRNTKIQTCLHCLLAAPTVIPARRGCRGPSPPVAFGDTDVRLRAAGRLDSRADQRKQTHAHCFLLIMVKYA